LFASQAGIYTAYCLTAKAS